MDKIEHFGKTGRHIECDRKIVPFPYQSNLDKINKHIKTLASGNDYYPEVDATGWCYTFDEDEPTLEEDAE